MTEIFTPLGSFENILDELERLSREHLLFYRVRIGSLLLDQFWGGDPAAFSNTSGNKEVRFDLFFVKCSAQLARYGISKRQARDNIRASIVVRSLPAEVAKQLFFSQLLPLTRLSDPTQRAQVAVAALQNDWTVSQLRDAVATVRAGLPLDADATEPGLQIVPPPEPRKKVVPGRMVTRVEKLAREVTDWAEGWRDVDPTSLRKAQRQRYEAAVTALEGQVARLRSGLDGVGDAE